MKTELDHSIGVKHMKRFFSAIAISIALVLPMAPVAMSNHAPVAGGYGEWPV